MKARWRSLAALGATLLLAGCVAIPTSGDVHSEQIDVDADEVPTVVLPPSPVPGQSPVEIVQGFLNAGRAPQNRYQVAQEFLASSADWSGTSRVLVTSSAINPVAVDEDTVAVTVTVIGEVDGSGHYTEVPSQVQTLSYDLTIVDGENRIARADPGTVLSRNGFAKAFGAYPLYFYDPSFDFLVPDLRWFPITRDVADRIVDELLLGPTAWLGSGVLINAFPQGTTGRAVYEAPEVSVQLAANVRTESALTQGRMIDQLDTSLRALGNVTKLVVTAGELDLAPASDASAPERDYLVRDGAIGGLGGQFGSLTADGVASLSVIGARVDQLQPGAATLARDRASVAVLGPAGVSVVGPSGDPVTVDARAGLIAPGLDPHGFVWSVPRGDPGALIVVKDGEQFPLPLDVDGDVVSLELARDGARVLVALATANGPRLIILGVQRNADLVPVAFGAAFELDPRGAIVDVAWVDGTHVAVLSTGQGGSEVTVLALGGPPEDLGEIDGATAIVGGNLVAGIRVLRADGRVHRPSEAAGWRDTGVVASFLGTQQ
ncbi:LpqB family beta-propeller domain-containing protein [Pseudolysinimonas sp.]|uniref:LpqB family beta-propeller domain-containing protein n=1 Tax=Pseudolysinimonas sp. TaxID=2680009 RepID=UPI00286C490F|nr:LpqB family beta-propeller domain-containing protein [Pseudolysinimonas sp.]